MTGNLLEVGTPFGSELLAKNHDIQSCSLCKSLDLMNAMEVLPYFGRNRSYITAYV